jgi:hypothetical protein
MIWASLTSNQRADAVRPLIEIHGLSFSQVATRLGTTKNSVIGLASRRKIKSRNPPSGAAELRKARLPASTAPKPRPPELAADPEPDDTDIWLPLPGLEPVRIEDQRDAQCRWPIGHHLYCGAPVRDGEHQVYCEAHHRIGVKAMPPKTERKPK